MNRGKVSDKINVSKHSTKSQKVKRGSKSEAEHETKKGLASKDVAQKEKKRSESLSRHEVSKSHPTSRKTESLDRSQLRKSSNSETIKKEQAQKSKRKIQENNSKPVLKHSVRRGEVLQKASTSSNVSRSSRSKAPKSNAEIAKSFVKNASKSQKINAEAQKKLEKQREKKTVHKNDQDEGSPRPRTSTIHKGPPDYMNEQQDVKENAPLSENGNSTSFDKDNMKFESDDEDKISYEEDFEDYDSDFEESDTDSVSDSDDSSSETEEENLQADAKEEENIINKSIKTPIIKDTASFQTKRPLLPTKTSNERSFLKMSDRSSLFPNKMEIKSDNEKPMKTSRSFINFASAVEQEKKKKYSNKVLKRASELLEIITLDVVPFDIIDVPPMKYETYIRTFGKSDRSQVFTQTENNEEEEAQTDAIEMLDKWTQYPPHDVNGCGSDNVLTIEGHKDWKSLIQSRSARLSTFLQNCSNVILTVLDEEFPALTLGKSTKQRNNLFYSNNYHILPSPNFLKDVPVRSVYCSPESSHHIITIYDNMIKVPVVNDERGILCVWNISDPQKPQHILMSNGQPTCVTFGPFGNDVVIAGMADGAVVLWDLTDSGSHCYPVMVDDQVSLMSPTYNTAVTYGVENHVSCIVAIQAVYNYAEDDRFSSDKPAIKKNFHVLTLEDMGIINVWVIIRVLKPDISGVDSDLGLAPGGKLRLVKSTSLLLFNLCSLPVEQKTNLRTFDFQAVPFDSSRFIVTTDAGISLHVTRHSGNVEPRYYLCDPSFSTEIRCLDFSPCIEDLFLIGCSDGSVKLFNVKFARPLLTLQQAAKGDPVNLLHWSIIHPAVFCVLSTSSTLYMWNIMKDTICPVRSYHFADSRVTWFVFRSEKNSEGKISRRNLNMILSKDNGEVEVHTYQSDVTAEDYAVQMEYMQHL